MDISIRKSEGGVRSWTNKNDAEGMISNRNEGGARAWSIRSETDGMITNQTEGGARAWANDVYHDDGGGGGTEDYGPYIKPLVPQDMYFHGSVETSTNGMDWAPVKATGTPNTTMYIHADSEYELLSIVNEDTDENIPFALVLSNDRGKYYSFKMPNANVVYALSHSDD